MKTNRVCGHESGVTLLAVMMLLTVLSIIAVGAFNVAIMENRMANNYSRVIANEPKALADIIDAFRTIQKTAYNGAYSRWTINLDNVTSYSAEYGTVTVRALTLQDLLDESIVTAADIAGSATFPDTSTDAKVYFGYHDQSNTLSSKVEYFTTTADEANPLPVLVMTTNGDSDANFPSIEAWVTADPALPAFAGLMARGTIYYQGTPNNFRFRIFSTLSTGEYAQCGGTLANVRGPYASISGEIDIVKSPGTRGFDTTPAVNDTLMKTLIYDVNDAEIGVMQQVSPAADFNAIINPDTYVTQIANLANTAQFVAPGSTALFPRIITGTHNTRPGRSQEDNHEFFYVPTSITLSNTDGFGFLAAEGTVVLDNSRWLGQIITKGDLYTTGAGPLIIGTAVAGGDMYIAGTTQNRIQGCQVANAAGTLPARILHIKR